MGQYPLLKILCFSFPQNLLVMVLAHGFMKKKMNFKLWILISIVVSVLQHYARDMIESFIMYTFFNLAMYLSAALLVNKDKYLKWSGAVLLSMSLSTTLEHIYVQSLILIFNINPLDFWEDIQLAYKSFIPLLIMDMILALYIYKKKIDIFKFV